MQFTNVESVAGMFPAFTRGGANQKPSDDLIQQYVLDLAGVILGVLERRFSEAVQDTPGATLRDYLQSLSLPTDQWYPSTIYVLGSIIADENQRIGVWQCTAAGQSGTEAPTFDPAAPPGTAVTDNQVEWTKIAQTSQFQVLERGNRYGAAIQTGKALASFGYSAATKIVEGYEADDWKPFFNELNAWDEKGKPKRAGAFDFLFDPQARVESPRPGMSAIAGGDMPITANPSNEGLSNFFGKWGIDFGRSESPFGPQGSGTP